jgi:hypothetical protein
MSTTLDQDNGSCDESRQAVRLGDRADADEFNRGSTLEDDDVATLNTILAVEDTVRAADHVVAAAEKVYDITRYAVSPVVVESPALQASVEPDLDTEARVGLLLGPRLRWGRAAVFACAAVVMTLSLVRGVLPIPVPNVAGLSWFARPSPDPAAVQPPDAIDQQSAPARQAVAVELAPSATDAALQPGVSQDEGTAEVNGSLPIQAPPAGVRASVPARNEAIGSEAPRVVVRQLNLEQIALLCKRGEELFAVGDIAAARLPLRRAAEAGDARSALMLARTYDPVLLEKLGTYGLAPDVALARLWYQRANELGAAEASDRLHMLAQWGR